MDLINVDNKKYGIIDAGKIYDLDEPIIVDDDTDVDTIIIHSKSDHSHGEDMDEKIHICNSDITLIFELDIGFIEELPAFLVSLTNPMVFRMNSGIDKKHPSVSKIGPRSIDGHYEAGEGYQVYLPYRAFFDIDCDSPDVMDYITKYLE